MPCFAHIVVGIHTSLFDDDHPGNELLSVIVETYRALMEFPWDFANPERLDDLLAGVDPRAHDAARLKMARESGEAAESPLDCCDVITRAFGSELFGMLDALGIHVPVGASLFVVGEYEDSMTGDVDPSCDDVLIGFSAISFVADLLETQSVPTWPATFIKKARLFQWAEMSL